MIYQVKLTNNAKEQLKETVWYISKVLLEPEIARHWSDRIKREILTLDFMPHRCPFVDEEPWRTEGIRKLTVDHFIVYYWINDNTATVWITAVVYGRRDQISALRNMPKESST